MKGSRGNMYSDVSGVGEEPVELEGFEREVEDDGDADLLLGLLERPDVR